MNKRTAKPKKRQKAKPAKRPALIIAHHSRILPASERIWDRGAVFSKWELDEIQKLARKHRAKNILQILSTKKI